MADFSKVTVNGTTYNVKDATARTAASAAQTTANSKLSDAPSDGKQYGRKDGAWVEAASGGGILYFYQQPVSAATTAEIMRITNAAITTDTIVLECTYADPEYVFGKVDWNSYAGYISFTGTCTAATTANVTLGQKGN